MNTGTVGILNVGAGDTKLTFDRTNPVEMIRACRIVRDMLRRGYALLVRLEDGTHTRALDFDENTAEYIIADFDPAAQFIRTTEVDISRAPTLKKEFADHAEVQAPQESQASTSLDDGPELAAAAAPRKCGRPTKRVAAEKAGAVAVARTSGG